MFDSNLIRQVGRRRFLTRAGTAAIAGTLANTTARAFNSDSPDEIVQHSESPNWHRRIDKAYEMRERAARYQRRLPVDDNRSNGDEERYPTKIANYSKSLQHDSNGRVIRDDYDALLNAITSGDADQFEKLVLGGQLKLVNPQAGLCFSLEGADSHHFGMNAPPSFSSAEQAGEMAELYWQALARDIPFSRYETDSLIGLASTDLSRLSDFRGPKTGVQVTPQTLFRGNTSGDLSGPYISQFLWQDVPYGAQWITQRIRVVLPELDYLTQFADWLAIQNGGHPQNVNRLENSHRFIYTARDLARYTQLDFTYQAFLNACLILLGTNASFDSAFPYRTSGTQAGFSTFGAPHILDLLAKAANCGLKAAWYQKWYVHRRLRPEEFGGAVHNLRNSVLNYPIHSDVLNSKSLDLTFSRNGSYLLPQAYAEGCPAHPAYPAGHAVIAGACATVLKIFFDEYFEVRRPVHPSDCGLSLGAYNGAELTVGGELNKLASNISMGRNAAGVHWRSDAVEGLKLGEAVAINLIQEERGCLNEKFGHFVLTKFDGSKIVV